MSITSAEGQVTQDYLVLDQKLLAFGYTSTRSYLSIVQGMHAEATTITTVSNLGTPHFSDLPYDIQVRIFEQLSTRERAQIAAVSRTWHQVSNANWTSVSLLGTGEKQVQAKLDWLQTISKSSSEKLRNVKVRIGRVHRNQELGDFIDLISPGLSE